MEKKFDLYAEVTNRIIEQLEQGRIPWVKPWTGSLEGAFNRKSKKAYSFMNQMLLKHEGEYATFKQWQELGGTVRKGEKSEMVVFWKMLPIEDVDKDGKKVKKTIPFLRYYNVFHISQIEGVEPLKLEERKIVKGIAEIDDIINNYGKRTGLRIEEISGDKAFYNFVFDYINVPKRTQFTNTEEFYSTLFHECVHSTGHWKRLDRPMQGWYEKTAYAKEELIAEIGACYCLNKCGISTDFTEKNSVAYIQSWLTALRNDKRLIVSAAGKAQKACELIFDEIEVA